MLNTFYAAALKMSLRALIISVALALLHNTYPFPEFFAEIFGKFSCMFLTTLYRMLWYVEDNILRLVILSNRVLICLFSTF